MKGRVGWWGGGEPTGAGLAEWVGVWRWRWPGLAWTPRSFGGFQRWPHTPPPRLKTQAVANLYSWLPGMTALTSLEIFLPVLLTELLPPSLRHLMLVGASAVHDAAALARLRAREADPGYELAELCCRMLTVLQGHAGGGAPPLPLAAPPPAALAPAGERARAFAAERARCRAICCSPPIARLITTSRRGFCRAAAGGEGGRAWLEASRQYGMRGRLRRCAACAEVLQSEALRTALTDTGAAAMMQRWRETWRGGDARLAELRALGLPLVRMAEAVHARLDSPPAATTEQLKGVSRRAGTPTLPPDLIATPGHAGLWRKEMRLRTPCLVAALAPSGALCSLWRAGAVGRGEWRVAGGEELLVCACVVWVCAGEQPRAASAAAPGGAVRAAHLQARDAAVRPAALAFGGRGGPGALGAAARLGRGATGQPLAYLAGFASFVARRPPIAARLGSPKGETATAVGGSVRVRVELRSALCRERDAAAGAGRVEQQRAGGGGAPLRRPRPRRRRRRAAAAAASGGAQAPRSGQAGQATV